jgi:hypothetical protein
MVKVSRIVDRYEPLWILIFCLVAFLVAYRAPVDYTRGDARGTLLTSQAILEHGTIRLDAYFQTKPYSTVIEHNGSFYYLFPLGTPVFATPVVALANLLGDHMADLAADARWQRHLAAVSVAASLALIYLIARAYLGVAASLFLATAFVFGSSIASTMGTALWNSNLAVVFILLALLLLVHDRWAARPWLYGIVLGLLLFAATFTRPTAAAFVVAVLGYLLIWQRRLMLPTVLGLAMPLGLLVAFSWWELGQPLPDYYLPSRLATAWAGFWPALAGNLISPARGLLVYSPFLLLTIVGALAFIRSLARLPLFWLALAWLLLHLVSIARLGHWWGGWSYGPRLQTDALPAWVLLTVLVWNQANQSLKPVVRQIALGGFAVLVAVSVLVHTRQGLYNPLTFAWNGWQASPNIDRFPEYLWDWTYPQFLVTPERAAARNARHALLMELEPLPYGDAITANRTGVAFQGWHEPEQEGGSAWRWSEGNEARLIFKLLPLPAQAGDHALLEVVASADPTQAVEVLVNGRPVGMIEPQQSLQPTNYHFRLPVTLLETDDENVLSFNTVVFRIPGAASPSALGPDNGDSTAPGLFLEHLTIRLPP